jgi:transcriptional regulator with XRE-family HTH domain
VTFIGVGATLRQERLQKQLSIEDIARQTRISHRFLRAIEADDFATLPGLVFARNFVRQYASLLGLDPAPLLARLPAYDLESAPMPASPLPSSDRSWWDPRWNSAVSSLAWIVLACAAAAAAYLYFNRIPRPQQQAAATRADVRPAVPVASLSPIQPPIQTAAPAAVPPAPSPVDTSQPDRHTVRVVVTARDDSWIQVTAEGKTAFIGVLKAGESRNFDSDGPVRLRTGNAGGIDISLNGKQIDSLGPAGQIRSVSLTAEGPQYAPKTPPASSAPA